MPSGLLPLAIHREGVPGGLLYGDLGAMATTKAAKHDPRYAPTIQTAHSERNRPVMMYTGRWGQPGTPVEDFPSEKDIPPGVTSNIRGRYSFESGTPQIDARFEEDATNTLAHELGHHIVAGIASLRNEPREPLADAFAGHSEMPPNLRLEALADAAVRQFAGRGDEQLGPREPDLDPVNRRLKQERESQDIPGFRRKH